MILPDDELKRTAERLAHAPVIAVSHAASGGNSRIYRVETSDRTYAMKYYPPVAAGARDRLGVETATLHFFAQHGVPTVPAVYGSEGRFALYDWIEGTIPSPVTADDIDAACAFLARLPQLSRASDATEFIPAAEACISLPEILSQIDRREARLAEIARNEPDLADFLTRFAAAKAERISCVQQRSMEVLAPEKRCLIPSDFGFHNALRRADGTLAFIDFEYFGWDDPVKLAADTLLHPGYRLSDEGLARLYKQLLAVFALDPDFAPRLTAYLPLFSLRWALILCNEFLAEKRANRAFASGADNDWEQAKQRQLAKATAMLDHPVLHLPLTARYAA